MADRSPRIEFCLTRSMGTAVSTAHVAHLKAVPRQVHRVRLQQIHSGHVVPREVTEVPIEVGGVELRKSRPIPRARRGEARGQLGNRAVQKGRWIAIDEISALR